MNEADFSSVIDSLRMGNGALFPIPIVLDVEQDVADQICDVDEVGLIFAKELVGYIRPESVFKVDKRVSAKTLFGFEDLCHPGVAKYLRMKDIFVGGPVVLSKRIDLEFSHLEMTPEQSKQLFCEAGWETVAAFHTRNIPHRAHEWLQRMALDWCDGLFIHPILGNKKAGDFTPEAIMTGYKALISEFFPEKRVSVSALTIAARYAGPREAIFHALVRRNFGCTHMIIGRDHAGVGGFYDTYASQRLCREFEDELGIQLLSFDAPHYCQQCDGVVSEKTCPHLETDPSAIVPVSGTNIRQQISDGKRLEKYLIRPEVIDSLNGIELFVK